MSRREGSSISGLQVLSWSQRFLSSLDSARVAAHGGKSLWHLLGGRPPAGGGQISSPNEWVHLPHFQAKWHGRVFELGVTLQGFLWDNALGKGPSRRLQRSGNLPFGLQLDPEACLSRTCARPRTSSGFSREVWSRRWRRFAHSLPRPAEPGLRMQHLRVQRQLS